MNTVGVCASGGIIPRELDCFLDSERRRVVFSLFHQAQ